MSDVQIETPLSSGATDVNPPQPNPNAPPTTEDFSHIKLVGNPQPLANTNQPQSTQAAQPVEDFSHVKLVGTPKPLNSPARPDFAKNPPPAAGPAPMQQVDITGKPVNPLASMAGVAGGSPNPQPIPQPVASVSVGAAKGVGETGHTVGRIINAATGDNIGQLPTSFQQPDYLRSDNGYETAGKVGEGVLEFVMGDAVLKGLTLSSKISIAIKLAKVVSDEPYVAKIVEAGINASRMGLVSGVQSGLHEATPGSVETGALTGLAGGLAGEALGAGAKAIFPFTKAGRIASATETAEKQLKLSGDLEKALAIGKDETLSNAAYNAMKDAGVPITDPSFAEDLRGYTFGDASTDIKDHFNDTFNKLRAETTPASGGLSQFDEASNQIKMAKRVLWSPTAVSVDSLEAAQKSLTDGEAKLEQVFNNSSISEDELKAAKDGWRKAMTLDDLHDVIDKSYNIPQEGRGVSGLDPELNEKRYVTNVNKAFRDIGEKKLTDALGRDGVKQLYMVHDAIQEITNDNVKAAKLERLTRAAMGAGSKGLEFGVGTGITTAASVGAHFLGATNPVVGGMVLSGGAYTYLYTHPEKAITLLKMASKSAPIATQLVKQGVTHAYDPVKGSVEPIEHVNQ